MSMLEINKLSWQPNKQQNAILDDISSRIMEGGFYGILGPNGSGKTSLIRHILRFLQCEQGSILLASKSLATYNRKELATQLAFVPQNTAIDVKFTVEEMVSMGRTPYLKRFESLKKADYDIIKDAMIKTNTWKLRDHLFTTLSGGEAQRVLIARAIAQQTKWLILDEPISHLDIRHQVELMEALKVLNRETKTTIIAILHDVNLAAAYCENIILMKNSRVYEQGVMAQVLTEANLEEVYEMKFKGQQLEDGRLYFIPVI